MPVISVGNLTWGGNGKTPMVEFIARWFAHSGIAPLILTRVLLLFFPHVFSGLKFEYAGLFQISSFWLYYNVILLRISVQKMVLTGISTQRLSNLFFVVALDELLVFD